MAATSYTLGPYLNKCQELYREITDQEELFDHDNTPRSLLKGGVKCNTPRNILPFCARIMTVTHKVMIACWCAPKDKKTELLRKLWLQFLKIRVARVFEVVRSGAPTLQLDFPISTALLQGEDIIFDDTHTYKENDPELPNLIASIRRLSNTCLGNNFPDEDINTILHDKKCTCIYAKARNGQIVAWIWGMETTVEDKKIFHIYQTAREPEYHRQTVFPHLLGHLGQEIGWQGTNCDFVTWIDEINNPSTKKALEDHKDWAYQVEKPTPTRSYLQGKSQFRMARLCETQKTPPPPKLIQEKLQQLTPPNTSKIYWNQSAWWPF